MSGKKQSDLSVLLGYAGSKKKLKKIKIILAKVPATCYYNIRVHD